VIDLDPSFGNWFAGFADGEGCFSIMSHSVGQKGKRVSCRFDLALRADDEAILEEIRDWLGGIGNIYSRYPLQGNPQRVLTIQARADCVILREVFLRYPLRAKKAADFKIWAEALGYLLLHRYGSSWDDVLDAKKRLETGRKYELGDSEETSRFPGRREVHALSS